ncbi:MAG: hypothetical protein HOV66_08110 [Streptomycetaceae bacterium]|jgi:hypothetical protein|uniref:Uncharacterized protein n=1 Tax=Yinghuangia aomiensis TaxID=676205 RepID=A0ABP9GJI4_9ACTN|nr:hypothetical protein [Streptomycetaceae bacterium]NUR24309.1 hypothetical protein [Catenulispora sp.]NUS54813.1 hypothetical protein [Streptomycetaceae bacterium]
MAKKKAPKSKAGKIIGVGMQVFGAIGVMKQIKEAKGKHDKLELADALISAAAVVTGFALLIRSLREEQDDHAEIEEL